MTMPRISASNSVAQMGLLARVQFGHAEPVTPIERQLLEAMPHRHTHRDQFADGPLPVGLMPALQHDPLAEGATVAIIEHPGFEQLTDIVGAVSRRQDLDPLARADVRSWSRTRDSAARELVHPAIRGSRHPRPGPGPSGVGRRAAGDAAAWRLAHRPCDTTPPAQRPDHAAAKPGWNEPAG
jgi:hypothetical protein